MEDYRFALEFKETLARLVKEEVERTRPRYRMATVVSFDRVTRKCVVNFPGDISNEVVNMGSIQPNTAGQVVRVAGLSGDRYIDDVLGPAAPPQWYPPLNLIDPGAEASYTIQNASADLSLYSNQYRIASSTIGSGGSVAAQFSTTLPHSGSKHLRFGVSGTGAPGNSITVLSPNFAVEPGKTYACTVWVAKENATVSRVYVRVAGGSTDALAEYPATNIGLSLPSIGTYENRDQAAINTYYPVTLLVTIPAGIYRASFRVWNYLPTAVMANYCDDFSVVEVDNGPLSDTGNLLLTHVATNFVEYGVGSGPKIRRVGKSVYFAGAVSALTGSVTSVDGASDLSTNKLCDIPVGFRPGSIYQGLDPVWVMQGSQEDRWVLRVHADGHVICQRYGPGTPSTSSWLPFMASWVTD